MRAQLAAGAAAALAVLAGATPALAAPEPLRAYTLAGGGVLPTRLGASPIDTRLVDTDRGWGLAVLADGRIVLARTSDGRATRLLAIDAGGNLQAFAGTGAPGFGGDGGPATSAQLQAGLRTAEGRSLVGPSLSAAPDGSLLFADTESRRVRRIAADGRIATIAGGGCGTAPAAPAAPALGALLRAPTGVSALADGSSLIADGAAMRLTADGSLQAWPGTGRGTPQPIRAIAALPDGSMLLGLDGCVVHRAPDGTEQVVAGNAASGAAGDGGPATAAQVTRPVALDVAADGALLIADRSTARVRAVDPSGTIRTVVAPGGGTAVQDAARLADGTVVVALTDGPAWLGANGLRHASLTSGDWRLVADGAGLVAGGPDRVWRWAGSDPDARPDLLAGGGPAALTAAGASDARSVSLAPADVARLIDGTILVATRKPDAVWRLGPDHALTRVAGTGAAASTGDGGPAPLAALDGPSALAPTADGGFLVLEAGGTRVRAVGPDGLIRTVLDTGAGVARNAAVVRLAAPLSGGIMALGEAGRAAADTPPGSVTRIAPDGARRSGRTVRGAALDAPQGFATTPDGLFAADSHGLLRWDGGASAWRPVTERSENDAWPLRFAGRTDGIPVGDIVLSSVRAVAPAGRDLVVVAVAEGRASMLLLARGSTSPVAAVAITPESVTSLLRRRLTVRATLAGRLRVDALLGGRWVMVAQRDVPAGRSVIALPARVPSGPVSLRVRVAGAGRAARSGVRELLVGPGLGFRVARRLAKTEATLEAEADAVDCRPRGNGADCVVGSTQTCEHRVVTRRDRDGVVRMRDARCGRGDRWIAPWYEAPALDQDPYPDG